MPAVLILERTAPFQPQEPPPRPEAVGPDWVTECNRLYARGNVSTLELAIVVRAARQQMKRNWSKFWRSSAPGLPFSKRTADMLVGVARLVGLSEQTFAHFPRGWSILYPLSRLEHDLLDRLVQVVEVHPELTLAEAKRLVRRCGQPRPPRPKRPAVKAHLNKFANFLEATFDDWSLEQRKLASGKLREILLQIELALASSRQSPIHDIATQN